MKYLSLNQSFSVIFMPLKVILKQFLATFLGHVCGVLLSYTSISRLEARTKHETCSNGHISRFKSVLFRS